LGSMTRTNSAQIDSKIIPENHLTELATSEDYKKWLYKDRHELYARYLWKRSLLASRLLFNNEFVSVTNDRHKEEILKAMGNLCRFHDIKYDTDLHQKFTNWIKKKEIKWRTKTYHFPKEQLTLKLVLENIKKLQPLQRDFALFMLTSGLRTYESRIIFEHHKKFCHDGVLEIFWSKKTKHTNATFCFPALHDKMDKKFVFDYDDFKPLGCELRYLRKLNFTINATNLDPLLAEYMQGRRGSVSERHYYLSSMTSHHKKWNKIWTSLMTKFNF